MKQLVLLLTTLALFSSIRAHYFFYPYWRPTYIHVPIVRVPVVHTFIGFNTAPLLPGHFGHGLGTSFFGNGLLGGGSLYPPVLNQNNNLGTSVTVTNSNMNNYISYPTPTGNAINIIPGNPNNGAVFNPSVDPSIPTRGDAVGARG